MSIQANINKITSLAGLLGYLKRTKAPAPAPESPEASPQQPEQPVNSFTGNVSKATTSAQQALAVKQTERRSSRRNFERDYLNNMRVSELSPEVRKQLAGTYNKYQRTKLMNRKDSEHEE